MNTARWAGFRDGAGVGALLVGAVLVDARVAGSATGADVAGAADVGAFAGRAVGVPVVVARGLAEAVDIGVTATVGKPWPVDAAFPQPTAIPVMSEAPAITRIALCAPRSNRMPTPIITA